MTEKTKNIVMTALMTALIFIATYLIRVPNPATGGYSHLGDCMVFLSVIMLGRKYGAAAAAFGGGLSDLLAGAAVWVLPTLAIKFIMAWIMGTIITRSSGTRRIHIVGASIGGCFQIAAYTLVKIGIIGVGPAVLSVPNVTFQTLFGIVAFSVIARILNKRIFEFMVREV